MYPDLSENPTYPFRQQSPKFLMPLLSTPLDEGLKRTRNSNALLGSSNAIAIRSDIAFSFQTSK
jgi:hypothetical protein